MTNSTINLIYGSERLTGVRISPAGDNNFASNDDSANCVSDINLECDTLITSLGLIPEVDLLWGLGEREWLFICGNARKVQTFADDVADDGTVTGECAAEYILSGRRPMARLSDPHTSTAKKSIDKKKEEKTKEQINEKEKENEKAKEKAREKENEKIKEIKCYLTSTVKTICGKRLPVKTKEPVPIRDFMPIMSRLRTVSIEGNIKPGQLIIPDVCGSGTDIIATKTMGCATKTMD
jgi:CxxC motif-containing protein